MKRKPHILYIVFCLCFIGTGAFHTARAQQAGIKTNLLYWATTTPNIGLEWRLAPRYTLSATVGYNAFNFPNRTDANGVAESLTSCFPEADVSLVSGGQPVYYYMIAAE